MELLLLNSEHIYAISDWLELKAGELQFFKGATNNNTKWQRDDWICQ